MGGLGARKEGAPRVPLIKAKQWRSAQWRSASDSHRRAPSPQL